MAADAPELAGAFAAALAVAHVEAGRIDDARRLLEEFAAADFDLPLDPAWLTGMVDYAEAAIACRDPKYAGPLFDRLAPWADQLPTTGITADGPVSHYLGGLATVLGRYDEADAYFAQAAAFNDRARRQVLRRPHQPLLGEDARRTQRSGRHRTGSRPSHQGARRRRGPRVRQRRTTRRRSTPTPGLTDRSPLTALRDTVVVTVEHS